MNKKEVLIIGAGPAGLTAAYELLKQDNNYDVIIVESSDFIGGISRTASYKDYRMDIGGHRFFSKDKRVTKIWSEMLPTQGSRSKDEILLGIEKNYENKGPNPEVEDEVMLLRKRVSRIFYLRKFFDYPISLKLQTFTNMGFINTMKAGFGYLGSIFYKRKEDNLENFYINRFGKPLYQMFFEDYTEKLWGVHPGGISADWGAQRVKGLSLSKTIMSALTKPFKKKSSKVETSLIEEFLYPKKGPGQLYEIMADKIKQLGGKIYLNQEVNKIVIEDNKVIEVQTKDNEGLIKKYNSDIIISSMAIKDLITSIEDKKCNEDIRHIATNLPYRDFITVGLLIDDLLVTNKTKQKTINNLIPDCWIYVQERDVKLGRIQIFNNWSPYMVKDITKNVWIGLEYFCEEHDSMWNMKNEDFIALAIKELIKIGMIKSSDNILDSTIIHVKKAYPAYFGTYKEFDHVKDYLSNIDNLYCVGRNGQHRYNNMDHSMATSIEAVNHILHKIEDKNSIWEVNTEKDYHEVKSE